MHEILTLVKCLVSEVKNDLNDFTFLVKSSNKHILFISGSCVLWAYYRKAGCFCGSVAPNLI